MSAAANVRATTALTDMIANGAVFRVVDSAIGKSFVFEVPGSGSSDRCRQIFREVRADTAVFAAFKAAVLDLAAASS